MMRNQHAKCFQQQIIRTIIRRRINKNKKYFPRWSISLTGSLQISQLHRPSNTCKTAQTFAVNAVPLAVCSVLNYLPFMRSRSLPACHFSFYTHPHFWFLLRVKLYILWEVVKCMYLLLYVERFYLPNKYVHLLALQLLWPHPIIINSPYPATCCKLWTQ